MYLVKNRIFLVIISIFFFGCSGVEWVPKPRGMNHIELPSHEYQFIQNDSLRYSFEMSKYAKLTSFKDQINKHVIDYGKYGAKIWLTHFPVRNSLDTLDQLIYTTYKLLQKNNVRAEAIGNDTIHGKNGQIATIFYLKGEVPTQFQFYLHDSTTNFVRGALYFETALKNDSLAPIISYVKEDISQMIKTLEWKK